jgi:hypothetical protein
MLYLVVKNCLQRPPKKFVSMDCQKEGDIDLLLIGNNVSCQEVYEMTIYRNGGYFLGIGNDLVPLTLFLSRRPYF